MANLLIVEDDPSTRIILEAILKKAGHETQTASDGGEALTILNDSSPDVVISDINMPGTSGLELLSIMQSVERLRDIPVIILTGEEGEEVLSDAFERGAMDYLRKPINKIELLARTKSAIKLNAAMEARKRHEKELEKNLQLLRSDLRAAAKVQQGLLPKPSLSIPGLDIAWHFRPCDDVGGDLFNIFYLSETEVAFYLLDVSGHGVSAALYAVSISTVLLQGMNNNGILVDGEDNPRRPGEVVSRLNEMFPMDLDTGKYFTMTYGVIDVENHTLYYTQAGHTPTLHCLGDEVEVLDKGDLPVGMMPGTEFTTLEYKLEPGSCLVLYTDGVVEAENSGGEFFGQERFVELVRSTSGQESGERVDSIMQNVQEWFTGTQPNDDISLLSIDLGRIQ